MIRLFSRNKKKEDNTSSVSQGQISSGKKICIFGGTFDPIHLGHLRMAAQAVKVFSLDKMIFMPSGSSYLKSNVTSADNRLKMTELAVEGFRNDKSSGFYESINDCEFTVSDIEIRREGKTYTYETLEDMRKLYPADTLYFLVGEDSLRHMEKWVNPQIVFADAVVIAATRPSKRKQEFDGSDHEIYKPDETGQDSDQLLEHVEDLQARLMKMYPAEIHLMNFDDNLSSHQIRLAASEGKPLDGMVTPSVASFISENRLYSE